MKLLTKETIGKLPSIYSTEKVVLEDKIIVCKFFTPWTSWVWFVFEGERVEETDDYQFFGMVHGHEQELGYFLLSELEAVRGPGGLTIERDFSVANLTYGEYMKKFHSGRDERMKTAKTFKEWMLQHYKFEELQDISQHGAVSGYSGLIDYSETTALYKKYKEDIWERLYEKADNLGISVPERIASFKGADSVCLAHTFENLLVWFCAEKIAYEAVCEREDNEW